jgi:hypothetical protein
MSRVTRLEFLNVELYAMKKMLLCVLAGAILTLANGLTQAGDCCCPKKCWSLPKLKMPHLKSLCSLGCKSKCDPCVPACAAAPTCAAPATMPASDAAPAPAPEAPPKPADLAPSAADPKK